MWRTFFLIFTTLYESIYLLFTFTGENFRVKTPPPFNWGPLVWMGLPFNFAGLLEYSNLQKVVGHFSHARTSTPGARATTNLYQKLNSLFGSGLFDSSLLARTELLKGSKGPFSLRDFNLVNILSQQKSNVNKTRLAFSLSPWQLGQICRF